MCNHYRNIPAALAMIETWREYVSHFMEEPPKDIWPRRKGLIACSVDGEKRLEAWKWGLPLTIPGKRPGTTMTKHITNIRNLKSNFWRSILTQPANRCLVPFTDFAEPKRDGGREECWFTVKEAVVSAFAGIWRMTEEGPAYAFLTCEPNPLIAPIHPQAMPVILQPEDYQRWLDGEDAEEFAEPFPSQLMEATGS